MASNTATTSFNSLGENERRGVVRRVAVSSFLGNFIEWFDYGSYSYFAVVLSAALMPSSDPTVAIIETFAVFALSFLLRPVGGFFWGHIGDRRGRKWALATSILLMSGASFLIGCIPNYATIGIGAPILLLGLRMVQSFSAAGEYAGAATFLAEYAPVNRRGLYCSAVPASTATGLLIATALAALENSVFGESSTFMIDWGWRIPFWMAGPLGIITHYIRTRLSDSPVYEQMQKEVEEKQGQNTPIKTLLTHYFKPLIISFGACMLNAVGFYMVLTFMPNYLQVTLGYNAVDSLIISTICLIVYVAFIFISGRISDRFGRKKMLIIACVGFIVFTVPAFYLMNTMQFAIILFAMLVLNFLLTLNDGTLSSYLTETFPTKVRYSGFALSFNFANAIFGGTASVISFSLIEATGSQIAPGWYMVVIAAIALVAMIFTHDHSGTHLEDVK